MVSMHVLAGRADVLLVAAWITHRLGEEGYLRTKSKSWSPVQQLYRGSLLLLPSITRVRGRYRQDFRALKARGGLGPISLSKNRLAQYFSSMRKLFEMPITDSPISPTFLPTF